MTVKELIEQLNNLVTQHGNFTVEIIDPEGIDQSIEKLSYNQSTHTLYILT